MAKFMDVHTGFNGAHRRRLVLHHVVNDHGHEDTPELREALRRDLADAPSSD